MIHETLQMGSIYKITNTVNGKSYIGKSVHDAIKVRISRHLNGHGSVLVSHAVKKYGKDAFAFEILHDGLINEILDSFEIESIKNHDTVVPNGYNLTHGGEGGIPSKETRQKISEGNKGKPSWIKGKTVSQETRRKISEANKGRKVSIQVRQKTSETHKGKTISPEHRQKISDYHKGRKHSQETRQKISEGNKGKTLSSETRVKISKAHIGKKRGNHSKEHRRKISEGNKGKIVSQETRQKLSKAKESPERIEARSIFYSLPPDMSLKEKRKHLRLKFPNKAHKIIHRWCEVFINQG